MQVAAVAGFGRGWEKKAPQVRGRNQTSNQTKDTWSVFWSISRKEKLRVLFQFYLHLSILFNHFFYLFFLIFIVDKKSKVLYSKDVGRKA